VWTPRRHQERAVMTFEEEPAPLATQPVLAATEA
jgi:hypothetical protein